MSVYQNRLVIAQGATFDRIIQFKFYPTEAQLRTATSLQAAAALTDPRPLTGTAIRGVLRDIRNTQLIDLAPVYSDAATGKIRVNLTPVQTAGLAAVKCYADFHEDLAGGGIEPIGRVLFQVIKQSTPID